MSHYDKYKTRDYGRPDDDFRKRLSKSPRKYEHHERGFGRDEARRFEPTFSSNKFEDVSKASSLKSQILDLESALAGKDAKMSHLEAEVRSLSEVESQQARTIKSLHDRLEAADRTAAEDAADRRKAESTITTLHSDNRQLQDRVLDLEDRLRKTLDARESRQEAGQEATAHYEELRRLICSALVPDAVDARSHEALLRRVKDYAEEQTEARSRLRVLEERLEAADDEVRRNRETVRALLTDIDHAKKFTATTEILKEERDSAIRHEEDYRSELNRMEDKLLEARRQWEEATYEARQHQAKIGEIDAQAKKHEMTVAVAVQEFKAFRETLATMLTESFYPISPSEEAIKERVRKLMGNQKDVNSVSRQLEEKLTEVSQQLEEQADLHKRAVTRAKKAEVALDEYRERMVGMEGELTATDILQNGLKGDKKRYLEFLVELARVMRMEEIVGGLGGVEVNGDSLLARAEQLTRAEADSYAKGRSARSLGPERRVKDLETELEKKTVQLNVMSRKLRSAEKDLTHTRAEQDMEELLEHTRRSEKGADKLSRQLAEAKATAASMKKDVVENQALRITVDELKRQLHETERRLDEVEATRKAQAKKLASLRHDRDQIEQDASQGYKVTESTIQSLSNQLQRLKAQLEETKRREKQLSDLRVVIARMLGLDVTTLAVADFEILSRLETLVASQHVSVLGYADPVQKGYAIEAQKRLKFKRDSPGTSRWK